MMIIESGTDLSTWKEKSWLDYGYVHWILGSITFPYPPGDPDLLIVMDISPRNSLPAPLFPPAILLYGM